MYRCTFQILRGCQGRRTSHVPPSLPPSLIFKAKLKICHPTLLKIRFTITVTPPPLPPEKTVQSENCSASIDSNGLLTLSRLLSLKFLLHMTTSFMRIILITAYKLQVEYKTITKLKQSTLWWRLEFIKTHNFTE